MNARNERRRALTVSGHAVAWRILARHDVQEGLLSLLMLASALAPCRVGGAQITLAQLPTESITFGPERISAADFNKGGTQDAIVTSATTEKVTVLFGDAKGSFEAALDVSVGSVGAVATQTPTPSGPGDSCDPNGPNPCDVGLVCNADGVCCEQDHCPRGQRCDITDLEGVCSNPKGPNEDCQKNADCAEGLSCLFKAQLGGFVCAGVPTPLRTVVGTHTPTPSRSGGSPCTLPLECASGYCADGVCCNRACDAYNEFCSIPGFVGTCVVAAIPTPTPTRTPAPQPLGAPCSQGSECHSTHCSSGVCCDRACSGRDEFCALTGFEGTCIPLSIPCVGDCTHDSLVTTSELLTGLNILLGKSELARCSPLDGDNSGRATIDELVTAIGGAMRSCFGDSN